MPALRTKTKGTKISGGLVLFFCLLLVALSSWSCLGAEETYTINLKRGYNLISLPVNRTFTYAEIKKSTVPAYALGAVSTWDPLTSRNIATANLEFGKGYWVYANCPGTITLTSFPPIHSSLSLKKGWNLIGCPKAKETPIDEALNPLKKDIDYQSLWIWDKTNYSASFTTLKPGEGYWMYMNKDFTLEINNEESFGELIGSEGGTIISPDKKAKLVIPQGALSAPTKIWLLNVDQNSLNGAQTGDNTMLTAAECRPQGLVFNKPVELIFILKQAEVPGTKITFAFYNPVTKVVTPTSLTSHVETDNYTLRFSLNKFFTPEDFGARRGLFSRGADSTAYYSGLKGPTSAPIGGGVKIPLPDMFTGAFSHSVSITVPPGRKGIQPSLALSYRSSNPNSWVGVGFSLNPGYIVRSTRLGPPSYNDIQDTFYFVTDGGTTELVHLIDNLYQAKIESSFAKFYKEANDSWRILGKDGSILKFGQSADSREVSSRGTFSWYITKAVDTNGNYIEYSYFKDQGKSYLSRIDYTGNENGTSPANSVEFSLESRSDIASSYISSSKIATTRRLKEIQTKQDGNLVWRYSLEYEYSPDTNRSILKSITQYGSDNKNLPTQTFNYQEANETR